MLINALNASLSMKSHIYQKLVLSVLLYALVTWNLLAIDTRSLEAFHMPVPETFWESRGVTALR